MKTTKFLISLLLLFAMCLSLMSTAALAEEVGAGDEGGDETIVEEGSGESGEFNDMRPVGYTIKEGKRYINSSEQTRSEAQLNEDFRDVILEGDIVVDVDLAMKLFQDHEQVKSVKDLKV